ncbi:hypothetical protein BO70DRAFT_429735 [Aspergillus heteromorphus CBS 117.55]|uniref:Zn(2)-C6 fungal-type domain-containing protein n=1 Tax=Aspergillus heteromorphus CBS 117.55 TaxID=1448321 RepID=A0A317W3Y8_9EURO|nr:uncharacterized protein BO70DRAFT_429735 [Aspergillus heteromorphus CBS 117.55]PWY80715.1 hypothetical protein BO70DRAFT_429735 [Aspergillus heteromorphus CBS 117.55]
MFGAFRGNNGAPNNFEYTDPSRNFAMDGHNNTLLACDSCRARKVKCNGDLYGCDRCRATAVPCTYHSSAMLAGPSSLKRPSWTTPDFSTPPSAKRQQTGHPGNDMSKPTASAIASNSIPNMLHRPPPLDLSNSRPRMPITPPGAGFANSTQDWPALYNMGNKPYQGLNINLGGIVPYPSMIPSLPMLHNPSNSSVSTVSSSTMSDETDLSDLAVTAPTNATPSNPFDYHSRRCECVRSLADTLEKISGGDIETSENIENSKQTDSLLMRLHDGVETCKRVVACVHCTVCVANSMLLVTIFQRLLKMSTDLSRHILDAQKKAKSLPPLTDSPPSPQTPDDHVSRYQIQIAAVCLRFVHTLIGMNLKHAVRLLDILRDRIGKKAKASNLLEEVIQTAQKNVEMLDEFTANQAASSETRNG